MTEMRKLVIQVPEDTARKIEHVTRRSLHEVAHDLIDGFFDDARRTQIAVKEISVRFPLDWYQRMLELWGDGQISIRIRKLLYRHLDKKDMEPLSKPPVWKERPTKGRRRKPTAVAGGPSCIKQIKLPDDWYTRLVELHGGKKLSTVIKVLVFGELNKTPGKNPLSIPKQFE